MKNNILMKVKVAQSSVVSNSLRPHGLYSPWNSPGQNTGVSSLSLLQEIFPTLESNPGLLHCKQILYQLSHKGSPRILEWVAYRFSSGSSRPKNRIGVSCIAGEFFTNWATTKTSRYFLLKSFASSQFIPIMCMDFLKNVSDLFIWIWWNGCSWGCNWGLCWSWPSGKRTSAWSLSQDHLPVRKEAVAGWAALCHDPIHQQPCVEGMPLSLHLIPK